MIRYFIRKPSGMLMTADESDRFSAIVSSGTSRILLDEGFDNKVHAEKLVADLNRFARLTSYAIVQREVQA